MTDPEEVEFSYSYDEREEKSIEELRAETVAALTVAFSNIEYILGNADFDGDDRLFSKTESMRAAVQEMIDVLRSGDFGGLERL